MTSKEFQAIQTYLTNMLLETIENYDFDTAKNLLERVTEVDKHRREAWNREKFGPYEEIADLFFLKPDNSKDQNEQKIHADDIPF